MKKTKLLALLMIVSATFSYAQKEKEELGKAEVFFTKKGSMFEKTTRTVGSVTSGKGMFSVSTPIEVMKIKDLMKNDSIYCVRMSASSGGTYATTVTGYIDSDELVNVQAFLLLMQTQYLASAPPSTDIEVRYRCESGFEIGCFKTAKNAWNIYISPKYYSSATLFYEKESIASLTIAFKQAKDMIDGKK